MPNVAGNSAFRLVSVAALTPLQKAPTAISGLDETTGLDFRDDGRLSCAAPTDVRRGE